VAVLLAARSERPSRFKCAFVQHRVFLLAGGRGPGGRHARRLRFCGCILQQKNHPAPSRAQKAGALPSFGLTQPGPAATEVWVRAYATKGRVAPRFACNSFSSRERAPSCATFPAGVAASRGE
jgi:hypothetical protein